MVQANAIFRAMADGTRQRVLQVLQGQELSVSELVEVLGQPQSTVSRHLKVLREAGLLEERKDGPASLCRAVPGGNGDSGGLGSMIHGWVAQQPLPGPIRTRLESIIARRSGDGDFFERVGREWDTLREESFGGTFHLDALGELIPRLTCVAEIGFGTGYLLPVLARRFDRVIGVEPAQGMIDIARLRVERAGATNVEIRRGELGRLPLDDRSVDLAISMLVLHHVSAPREALVELARVIRPGGRVLIVEQDAHDAPTFHERMRDRWWGFERETFADWLERAGFSNVTIRDLPAAGAAADAPGLFVALANVTKQDSELLDTYGKVNS